MTAAELAIAGRSFGFCVAVFVAFWAVLRFGFGVGTVKKTVEADSAAMAAKHEADKKAIESAIAHGFSLVRSEVTTAIAGVTTAISDVRSWIDKFEKSRAEEAKERAVAAAAEQQRQINEAVRRAQSEEREKTLFEAVKELRRDLDEHLEKDDAEHDRIVDRAASAEAKANRIAEGHEKTDGHVKSHARTLQDHHDRIRDMERKLSMPSIAKPRDTQPMDPRRDPERR